jgi:hypothetical protein
MKQTINVVVGTPIYRQGAYILDKFLANQKEIQQNYPSSELVFATNENDFGEELKSQLSFWGVRGEVILYKTIKPDYARSKNWNIACGREAIRKYTLSQIEASYLLFLDADMTFDPSVIKIMEEEIQGYDVVFSGCASREFKGYELGAGCSMLTRHTLEKIRFRCLEFKNGEVILEGCMRELDLIKLGSKAKKGFFISIDHYKSENEAKSVNPQPLGLFRSITTSRFVRYILISTSIILKHDISGRLARLVYSFLPEISSHKK